MCRLCKIRSLDTKESKIPYWVVNLKDNQDIEAAYDLIKKGGYLNLSIDTQNSLGRIYSESDAHEIVNLVNARAWQYRNHPSGQVQDMGEFLKTHRKNIVKKAEGG